jgi:hypothetical protein
MFPGDLPRQDHPLPKAFDDATAARLLPAARAARADRRMLVRVTVEMLLRTGSSPSSMSTATRTSRPVSRCYCRGRTAGRWTGTPSPG